MAVSALRSSVPCHSAGAASGHHQHYCHVSQAISHNTAAEVQRRQEKYKVKIKDIFFVAVFPLLAKLSPLTASVVIIIIQDISI